jgi:hypothetical protein
MQEVFANSGCAGDKVAEAIFDSMRCAADGAP